MNRLCPGALRRIPSLIALLLSLSAAAAPPAARAADSPETGGAPPQTGSISPTGDIALGDAVAAALLGNLELSAFPWEVRAREARAVQAKLHPNPELALELENIGGSGDRAAFEQSETTLWLSQLIELAGKRDKRHRMAALEGELARWDYASSRASVLTATTKAFVAVLADQRRAALAAELEALAERSVANIAKHVQAGAASPVETSRADLTRLAVQLERAKLDAALTSSRAALAAHWGESTPRFAAARGDLGAGVRPAPALAELEGEMEANPDLARWRTELAEREAALALARARAIPDPTLGLGARYFSDNEEAALVFAVGMPLPLFDRNQGAIQAAQHDLAQGRARQAAAEQAVRNALAAHRLALAAAYERAVALRERTLPAAQRTAAEVQVGFRQGRFRYLEVLDAQRALADLRNHEIDALQAYHLARADLDRLTAAAPAAATDSGARP